MDDKNPNQLQELLRAGDPAAADPGLSAAERAAMRRRFLDAAADQRRRPAGWLLPAAAAATLFALALGLAWRSAPEPPVTAARPAAVATEAADRQIQFTTDRGTLVVWVLQPRTTS